MGIFNLLLKNEVKLVAKSIAAIFKKVNGEYDVAYATIANHWLRRDKALRNLEPLHMAADNRLSNLSMLAVAEFNALSARRNTPYQQSHDLYYEKIMAYLEKQKIPQQYISGENFQASQKAAEVIKQGLKDKGLRET